jgi:hypothetical protein
MYIVYIVNFSNPLEIQLKQKVKQSFSTAAIFLLYVMLHFICIFPYDLCHEYKLSDDILSFVASVCPSEIAIELILGK